MLFYGVDCGYAVGKCVGVRHDGVAGAEVFLKAWMLEQEQCCVCGVDAEERGMEWRQGLPGRAR